MINPTFGMTPEQMEAAKAMGQYVGAKFIKGKNCFSVEFVPRKSPEELAQVKLDLGQLVDQLVYGMATYFNTYMGIEGEILLD